MLIKEDAADLQDMVEIASGEPQAKTDRTPQAAERDFKRDDDGKFATDGGGGGGKKEDRRFPGRPTVGAVVNTKATKIGPAKIVVTKSEDREVDFGDKAGTVIDDAVQMEVRIGTKVIKTTKVGTTADAEREADKILKKAVENAEKVGQPAVTKTVAHAGKDVEIQIVHDGYGAYHGQLKTTREDGLPVYTDDGSFKFNAPDRVGVPREGEFKSPERAATVMEKRAQQFAEKLSKAEQAEKEESSRESEREADSPTESSEQTEQRHETEQASLSVKHDEEFSKALDAGAENDDLDALTQRHEAEMAELQRKHAKELDGE
jgi:hypothetical protein